MPDARGAETKPEALITVVLHLSNCTDENATWHALNNLRIGFERLSKAVGPEKLLKSKLGANNLEAKILRKEVGKHKVVMDVSRDAIFTGIKDADNRCNLVTLEIVNRFTSFAQG